MKIHFLLNIVNYTYTNGTPLVNYCILLVLTANNLKKKPRVPLKLLSNILLLDKTQGLVLNL